MTENKYMKDLEARWRPSEAQIDLAEEVLPQMPVAAGAAKAYVYTPHVLVNKSWGFWTLDVEIEYPENTIFLDRDSADQAARLAAKRRSEELGKPCIGGWAMHWAGRNWAVWDCLG